MLNRTFFSHCVNILCLTTIQVKDGNNKEVDGSVKTFISTFFKQICLTMKINLIIFLTHLDFNLIVNVSL